MDIGPLGESILAVRKMKEEDQLKQALKDAASSGASAQEIEATLAPFADDPRVQALIGSRRGSALGSSIRGLGESSMTPEERTASDTIGTLDKIDMSNVKIMPPPAPRSALMNPVDRESESLMDQRARMEAGKDERAPKLQGIALEVGRSGLLGELNKDKPEPGPIPPPVSSNGFDNALPSPIGWESQLPDAEQRQAEYNQMRQTATDGNQRKGVYDLAASFAEAGQMGEASDLLQRAMTSGGGQKAAVANKRLEDWDAISQIQDPTEKSEAIQDYLYKWAPSVGYQASPESIDQAIRKEDALLPSRTRTAAATSSASASAGTSAKMITEDQTNKNLGRTRIDPTTGQPYTQSQYVAAGFASRMAEAENTLSALDDQGFDATTVQSLILSPDKLNKLRPGPLKEYVTAKRAFINSQLRRESGAAIAKSEFENADKQYFPQFGDDAKTIEEKRRLRQSAQAAMSAEAGGAKDLVSKETQKIQESTRSGVSRVSSQADYDKLPSGAEYIDPNGIKRRKK